MSTLNPRAKLLHHGGRVKEWLDTGSTRPVLIEISPTGYCNADCPWCFFKSKNSGEHIKTQDLLTALEALKKLGLKAVNWTGGGEPTLHPDFAEIVLYTSSIGLKQGIFTNGYQVIPHQGKFEWIRISLTPKGYAAIKKPKVPFGICLNHLQEHTEFDLRALCSGAARFGASYFQIRPALFHPQPAVVIPEYLKEYETEDFRVELTPYKYAGLSKDRSYTHCYGFHFCPALNWKGEFNTCMYFANDPRFILGTIYDDKLSQIFDRMKFVKVVPECQSQCKNHEINVILDDALKARQVDFL